MPHILYQGPSMIDGEPIIAVATGITSPSNNAKTGPMVQTWIMRSDIPPIFAASQDADKSVCGDCQHRGVRGKQRSCYVQLHQAPTSIYNSWNRGPNTIVTDLAALGAKRSVRVGSYGDPSAVPFEVWNKLISRAYGYTGYTHLWGNADMRFKTILMASVDSDHEANEAQKIGWRTFRVKDHAAPVGINETYCPADMGEKQCINCLLCSGNKLGARNITINVHGAAWKQKIFKEAA